MNNKFHRITLVNDLIHERVTLDVMIQFKNDTQEEELRGVVIAEVKQEQHYYDSAFKQLMQHERIFPVNISKYCMGTLLTHPALSTPAQAQITHVKQIRNGIA